MNCRQGDIAVVIRSNSVPEAVGRLVKVLWLETEMHWKVEFIGSPVRVPTIDWIAASLQSRCCCADAALRPIRDPGDDATDEMVLRAGNPNHKPADRETPAEHRQRVLSDEPAFRFEE